MILELYRTPLICIKWYLYRFISSIQSMFIVNKFPCASIKDIVRFYANPPIVIISDEEVIIA